jgi:hypothetical protein
MKNETRVKERFGPSAVLQAIERANLITRIVPLVDADGSLRGALRRSRPNYGEC